MPVGRINGGDLYYETHGSGPPLIFAHGSGGNALSWWQQVPHFRDRYTCITYDAPGFGRSDDPAGTWSYIDTLAGLIQHLALEEVSLVAQSMGGWGCLGYALAHPGRVQALVLAGTSAGTETMPELAAFWRSARAASAELGATGIHPACGARMAREQPAAYFLYTEIARLNPAATQWPGRTAPIGGFTRVPKVSREALQQLTTPVLYLVGEEDPLAPPPMIAALAAMTPNARLVQVPGAGHSLYFERPDRFNRAVTAFLRQD